MKLKKATIFLIIPFFLIWTITFADAKPSTRYSPETVESEPVDVVEVKPEKKGISGWWFVLIIGGGLLVTAAAIGGKKTESSSGGSSSSGSGGTIPVSW